MTSEFMATGPGDGWLWVGRGSPPQPVKLAICWGVHVQMCFDEERDQINVPCWRQFVVFASWRARRNWRLWGGRRHWTQP